MTIDVFPGSHHADLRYGNTARTAAFSAAANNDDTRMTTMCIWKVAQSKPSSQQKIDLNLSPESTTIMQPKLAFIPARQKPETLRLSMAEGDIFDVLWRNA
ncbi:hypothetical protein B2J93_6763 [Marssonina coronariae]|uniref:Uncharacterized protein n=1 Tax=Diplocarpon coronariae TaxID=2795749 RepID=A0A218Z5Z1_9HELO|nr:hypothetical protein B2J93_6763 [Marssonina coronariae]